MYSNSNAFLGGNSQRPGGQQFGAGGFGQPQQQQQQQPGPFAPQPTGFGQQPLQQQYTGYPLQAQQTGMPQQQQQQPLQQQYTGYVGPTQNQQGFQSGSSAPPMPSIPSQYQQQFQRQQQQQQPQQQQQSAPFQQTQPTGFAPSPQQSSGPTQPPPPPMKPQPTGFTQMAASFQTGGSSSNTQSSRPAKTNKIPNIRLTFITAQDQTRFETLFKSAVGDGSTMSGEKARDLLVRSNLPGDDLSQIWYGNYFASTVRQD